VSDTERPRRKRAGAVEDALHDLEVHGLEGSFSSMGMLITDSVLSGDQVALTTVRDGLRHLIGLTDRGEIDWGSEQTGRARSLLIGAMAGLTRIAPDNTRPKRRKIETLPGI